MSLSTHVGSNHLGNPQSEPLYKRLPSGAAELTTIETDSEAALGRDIERLFPALWLPGYARLFCPFADTVAAAGGAGAALRPAALPPFLRGDVGALPAAAALDARLAAGHAVLAGVGAAAAADRAHERLWLRAQLYVDSHIFMHEVITALPAPTRDALVDAAAEYYAAWPSLARAFSIGRLTDLAHALVTQSQMWDVCRARRDPFVVAMLRTLLEKGMAHPCARRSVMRMLRGYCEQYVEVRMALTDLIMVCMLGNFAGARRRPGWAARVAIVRQCRGLAQMSGADFAAWLHGGPYPAEHYRALSLMLTQFMRVNLCHTVESWPALRAIAGAANGFGEWSAIVYHAMEDFAGVLDTAAPAGDAAAVQRAARDRFFRDDGALRSFLVRVHRHGFAERVHRAATRYLSVVAWLHRFGVDEVMARARAARDAMHNAGRTKWPDTMRTLTRYVRGFPDAAPEPPAALAPAEAAFAHRLGELAADAPTGVFNFAQLELLGVPRDAAVLVFALFVGQEIRRETRNHIVDDLAGLYAAGARPFALVHAWLGGLAAGGAISVVPLTPRVAACQEGALRRAYRLPPGVPLGQLADLRFCTTCRRVYNHVAYSTPAPPEGATAPDKPRVGYVYKAWERAKAAALHIRGMHRGRSRPNVAEFCTRRMALVCPRAGCGPLARVSLLGQLVFVGGVGYALCAHGTHVTRYDPVRCGERGPTCGYIERFEPQRIEPMSVGRSNSAFAAAARAISHELPRNVHAHPYGACYFCPAELTRTHRPLRVADAGGQFDILLCDDHEPVVQRVLRRMGVGPGGVPAVGELYDAFVAQSRPARWRDVERTR
jgi:hypothetical protein